MRDVSGFSSTRQRVRWIAMCWLKQRQQGSPCRMIRTASIARRPRTGDGVRWKSRYVPFGFLDLFDGAAAHFPLPRREMALQKDRRLALGPIPTEPEDR